MAWCGDLLSLIHLLLLRCVFVCVCKTLRDQMDLFWDDGSYGVIVSHKIEGRGGKVDLSTFVGHQFYFCVHGRRQQVGGEFEVKLGVGTYELPADVDTSVKSSACQDRFKRCKNDKKNGECTRNPGWMIVNCPESCNACEMLVRRRLRLLLLLPQFSFQNDFDFFFFRSESMRIVQRWLVFMYVFIHLFCFFANFRRIQRSAATVSCPT